MGVRKQPNKKISWVELDRISGRVYAEMITEALKANNIPCFINLDWFGSAYGISGTNNASCSAAIYVQKDHENASKVIMEELMG